MGQQAKAKAAKRAAKGKPATSFTCALDRQQSERAAVEVVRRDLKVVEAERDALRVENKKLLDINEALAVEVAALKAKLAKQEVAP